MRFGGAGAVFPFLFVVLLICTDAEFGLEKVLNFDEEVSVIIKSNDLGLKLEEKKEANKIYLKVE